MDQNCRIQSGLARPKTCTKAFDGESFHVAGGRNLGRAGKPPKIKASTMEWLRPIMRLHCECCLDFAWRPSARLRTRGRQRQHLSLHASDYFLRFVFEWPTAKLKYGCERPHVKALQPPPKRLPIGDWTRWMESYPGSSYTWLFRAQHMFCRGHKRGLHRQALCSGSRGTADFIRGEESNARHHILWRRQRALRRTA